MRKHITIHLSLLLILIFKMVMTTPAHSQVKIQKILSPANTSQIDGSSLVLLDFWATWCVPCIHIGKQLEITQEQFKDDLAIISISKEHESVVQVFINKQHPRLIIALDAQEQTFKHFQVNRSIPYAVLLNQRGEVLFRGHPADLSIEQIKKHINQNRKYRSPNPLNFISIADTPDGGPSPTMERKEIHNTPFSLKIASTNDNYFIVTETEVQFSGKTSQLLSELLKIPKPALQVEDDPMIEVIISYDFWQLGAEIIADRILDTLNLHQYIVTEEADYYWLKLQDEAQLWNQEQIQLGQRNGIFLIDEENLQLDNASINDLAFRLSGVLDRPVYTPNKSPRLHDWLIHYKYWNFTREQLLTEYHIIIEPKTGLHQMHYFNKQAPF